MERNNDLKVLFFEVTQKCNAHCNHCGSQCDINSEEGISSEYFKSALLDIKQNLGTNIMLNITGGEPLIRKDLFDITEYANKLGFDWGTAGAAYATWLSQCTVVLLFIYQVKIRKRLWPEFRLFVPLKKRYSFRIYQLGLPVALLNSFFAIINLLMGRTATTYGGHIGLMALTAGGQIEAIAWNTSQGFSTALSAFTAQNYAARKQERIHTAYRMTLLMTSIFGLACTLLFVFWGSDLFGLFVPEKAAYIAGGEFLRIDGYSMMFMMLEITMQGLFYGTGRTVPPAIISITFNTLRVPLAIFLGAAGLGITGVWWAISISSILKGITSFIWFRSLKVFRQTA